MPFMNREEAGERLAAALLHHRSEHPVILALPRGGVPVGAKVAKALAAPLDLLLVRKIGAPMQPEVAMGAVVDGIEPVVVRNEDVIRLVGIGEDAFRALCRSELAEIERRRRRYLAGLPAIEIADRVAIVVDDGIATGATIRAGLQATRRRKPSKLILAVPVSAAETLAELEQEVDEVVCLESHVYFGAIGAYYADFTQVTDEEVIALLGAARSAQPLPPPG